MLRQQIYRSKCLPIYQDVRFLIIYVQWGLFYNCKNNQSILLYDKDTQTRPISDGFRKNNVNYWAFREIRSIIPHL